MKLVLQFLPWKRGLYLSIGILAILIVLSFYGLYTNKFYFFKFENYIIPILSIVHFGFLYVLKFKIKEQEVADIPMRNMEYGLYIIILVYIFKLFDTLFTLMGLEDIENHFIPESFMPMGIFISVLYLLLILLTLLTFQYRKQMVGGYNFDEINQIDSWE